MSDTPSSREDLRAHVRQEEPPSGAVVVLRGGPGTVEKLATHARRTHLAFSLDGEPVWGVSVFAALDDLGPASRDGLLADRLATYRLVHMPSVGALADVGFDQIPTFRRPHLTLLLSSDAELEVRRLLEAIGPPQINPYHGSRARRR